MLSIKFLLDLYLLPCINFFRNSVIFILLLFIYHRILIASALPLVFFPLEFYSSYNIFLRATHFTYSSFPYKDCINPCLLLSNFLKIFAPINISESSDAFFQTFQFHPFQLAFSQSRHFPPQLPHQNPICLIINSLSGFYFLVPRQVYKI